MGALLFAAAAPVAHANVFNQSSASDGIVSMEAENATAVVAANGQTWTPVSGAEFSGNSAMLASPNQGTFRNTGYVGQSPRMDFAINFNRTGTHYVWLRGVGASSADDSAHVGLNGSAVSTADRIAQFGTSPNWSRNTHDGVVATVIIPSTGVHTINVWMREDGFVIDKVLLASDQAFVPTNFGPAESTMPSGGFNQSSASNGLVSMEAENATEVVAANGQTWSEVSGGQYSNSTAMIASPNQGTFRNTGYVGASPRMDFTINFNRTGTHFVWLRGVGASSSDDSAHVGLNGAAVSTADRIAAFGPTPTWSRNTHDGVVASIVIPSTGVHTVNVWMREDGFVIDKIVLTSDNGYTPTGNGPAESSQTVFAPTISPNGGTVTSQTGITLASNTENATIRYTTDGSTPSASSTLYTAPFTLADDATVRAIAFRAGFEDSMITSATFAVAESTNTGGFDQSSGVDGIVSMEAENATEVVAANGQTWSEISGGQYSGNSAMQAAPNQGTFRNTGYVGQSPRMDFEINFNRTGTHYVWLRGVGASSSDDSAHVGLNGAAVSTADRIAQFGTSPNWSRNTHDGVVATIVIPSTGMHTVNVWMREDGFVIDKVLLTSSNDYTPTGEGPAESEQTVFAPTISPNGGSITSQTGITLETVTPSSTIRYTTNGSTPTSSSTLYTGPFTLASSATVRARAFRSGFNDSIVTSASFTVSASESTGGFEQSSASNGLVSMEAENATEVVAANGQTWSEVSGGQYSGNSAMLASPNQGTFRNTGYVGASPRMDFAINFNRTGTHYVWLRGEGASSVDDSAHVGLNGAAVSTADRIAQFGPTPTWSRNTHDAVVATIVIPSTGVHTVNVWMREDGFVIDKIVLTTDDNYTPTGNGPAESAQTVFAPTISPNGGSISSGTGITLATSTPSSTIRYTTDGSTPTSSSTLYTAPFTLGSNATVRARAFRSGFNDSIVTSATFTVASGGGFQQDAGGNGLVVMEAESYHLRTSAGGHSWQNVVAANLSGGEGMEAQPNTGTTRNSGYSSNSPRMDYTVTFNRTGTHYVWLRGVAANGGADTVHVGINGAETATSDRIDFNVSSSPAWTDDTLDGIRASISVPSTGEHTINVWMREDGFRLDKILLTSNASYTPTGSGPAESQNNIFEFAQPILRLQAEAGDTSAVTDTITLSSTNGAGAAFTLSDDASWLTLSPTSGTTPSSNITLSANPSGLSEGVYTATVTASGGLPNGTLDVELYVATPLPITRNFSSGNTSEFTLVSQSGDAANWSVGSGSLRQLANSSVTLHGFTDIYTRGQIALLDDVDGLHNFRAVVDVTQTGTLTEQIGLGVGLMFRAADANNYYRLAVNGKFGFTELVRMTNGTFETLAVNARGYEPGQALRLGVEAIGGVIRAYVADTSVSNIFATTPVLTAFDTTHVQGTVGLYTQSRANFDNLSVTAAPTSRAQSVEMGHPFQVFSGSSIPASTLVTNGTGSESVTFRVDGSACGGTSQPTIERFSATCSGLSQGEHSLTADGSGGLADTTSVPIATGGLTLLTIGDSITNGWGDLYSEDNVGHDIFVSGANQGPRMISTRGYQAPLHDALEDEPSFTQPTVIFDTGVPGDTTDENIVRLPSILTRYAMADEALIMLGTNDAISNIPPPSGLGCSGSGCNNTYKGSLLTVVDQVQAAGMVARVAKLPPVFGLFVGAVYADPANNAQNVTIREYNQVVDEVNSERGLTAGPDFYNLFFPSGDPRIHLMGDNLHPGSYAFVAMAQLWANILSGTGSAPLVLAELCLELNGAGCQYPSNFGDATFYEQLRLGVGDEFNVERTATLTSIPAILDEGIWITTARQHRNNSRTNFLRFDVDRDVDVYVAYDSAAAQIPTWLQSWTDTGQNLGVSSASGTMDIYTRSFNGPTTIQLGGPRASGQSGAIDQNYLVIVKEQ